MRIFPALWVSSLLFVTALGLFFSPLPATELWSREDTISYLLKNATMLPGTGAQTDLPFAFDVVHREFNTSLWTLPHELQMYMLLCLLGIVGALRFPLILVGVALVGATGFAGDICGWFQLLDVDRARFIFLFFCGSSSYLFRDRVPMSRIYAAAGIAALVAVAILTRNHVLHRLVLIAVLPFLTLWFGFVPGGRIRQFNRVGDYSYGIYILSCPVQFYLADRYRDLSPWGLFALSMMVVMPLAIISWRYIESRALAMPLPQWLAAAKHSS